MNALSGRFALVFTMALGMALGGCASGPHGTPASSGRGVVQDVQRLDPAAAGQLGVIDGGPVVAGAPGARLAINPVTIKSSGALLCGWTVASM